MRLTLEQHLSAAAARLAGSATPRLDARVLAKHVLALDDAGLILEAQRALTAEEAAALEALLARRERGEPVAYIVGSKEFWGLTFQMAPGVLVPRPDTETLVSAAIARRAKSSPLQILDLGTGSGALLCALLAEFPNARGVGLDVNEAAVRLAAANVAALGFDQRASLSRGSWTDFEPAGRLDLIVSNPPYIRSGDRDGLSPDVRDFEDGRALFAGEEGLDAYREILARAPRWLAPEGLMILELGLGHVVAVGALAEKAFAGAEKAVEADLSGLARALVIDLSARGAPQKRG